MNSIEYWKMPLIEMHGLLWQILNEKNQEILNSFYSENRTNNMSKIQNRLRDVEQFRRAIDRVHEYSDFMPGFQRDFERIRDEIEKIQP